MEAKYDGVTEYRNAQVSDVLGTPSISPQYSSFLESPPLNGSSLVNPAAATPGTRCTASTT
jgi:hypothetical protein